jgi:predicted anti-sigma-YlaC factor YlaD
MLNCKSATRLVSEAQERPLSVRERMGLNIHLLMCSGCRNFSEQIPLLRQAMRGFARGDNEKAGK